MQHSSFFNSINGDRRYNAEEFALYFSRFIGNGVFPNPSNNLQVTCTDTDMKIQINPGYAWINGYFYWLDDTLELSLTNADGILNRIDKVVLQYNVYERAITIKIKEGEYGDIPVEPALTRNYDIYELGIANVKIEKGDTKVYSYKITDLRLSSQCGVVTSLIDQVSTNTLFNQYQSYLDKIMSENEFDTWFKNLKDKLDPTGDIAVQLQSQIWSNLNEIKNINRKIEEYSVYRENVDINGIYTQITWKDEGENTVKQLTLSNIDEEGNYSRATLIYYKDGKISLTIPYELTYNEDKFIGGKRLTWI